VSVVGLVTIAGVGCAGRGREYEDVSIVTGPGHRSMSNRELVARVEKGIAVVETDVGRGMAFVIDPSGFLLTNRHVLEDADHIVSVTFPALDPPRVYESAKIVYIDPARDLALLHVNAPEPLPRLPLAARKSVPVSRYIDEKDPVVMLRYAALDKGETKTKFSALNASVTTLEAVNPAAGPGKFIGVNTKVKQGQSGGPILDRFGRVVGVVTWTWKDRGGGYAIPISDATKMLDERPKLDSDQQHETRVASRSREFLAALGRGDVDDARRLTSPSHARRVREAALAEIFENFDENGMPVIQGFISAVESLVDVAPEAQFERLRDIVARTGSKEFRRELGVGPEIDQAQVMSFFLEFGQAYLVARSLGAQSPGEALNTAMKRLQTVDAARTFAIADVLEELAGNEIEIEAIKVVPGAYTPTAVVSLKTQRRPSKLSARFGGKEQALTLHMKLEWGDWYVAEVNKTPLSEDKAIAG
jgi:S1-C subfamily serine protease